MTETFCKTRSSRAVRALALVATAIGASAGRAEEKAAARIDFARGVRPILAARCAGCHGAGKQKGGLRLDTSAWIRKGGASGAILGPAATSLLLRHVAGDADLERMPPEGEPLTAAQITTLRRWIEQGASLPADPKDGDSKGAASPLFGPLMKPTVPKLEGAAKEWARTPIDAFIGAKLAANGLRPAPAADLRTLARRVSIDLVGLPPTPEELAQLFGDSAPGAYERYVDKLLASPRHGERWARHWLDVARYADSHGQDQDRFRPNAWPYRDYLIRSFNADKPYARFVREQIAGDAAYPGEAEALVATGFLAAGPWDESGLRDINENSIDREIARYLDRDDIVTGTMTAFTGLTAHCARCHDHKFDPITQEDYYALQAVFAGIDKAERAYDADPKLGAKRTALAAELERVRGLKGKSDPALATPEDEKAIAALEEEWRRSEGRWIALEPETWTSKHGASLKALLDRSILSVGTAPDRDVYTVTATTRRKGIAALRLELLCDDTLPHQGPGRCHNGNLHLSEIRVTAHPEGKPEQAKAVKLKGAFADFDQAGWGVPRAIDGDPTTAWGIYPEVGKPHQATFEFDQPAGFEGGTIFKVELDQLHGGVHLIGRFRLSVTTAPPGREIAKPVPGEIAKILATPAAERRPVQRAELARWLRERRLTAELAALPPIARVYCGTNRFAADGSFKPATTPRPVRLLQRGEIGKPGEVVPPGTVAALAGSQARFALKNGNDEGARRLALADWIASRDNPLTWRVIVNRVWHHHFGKGIVDTPNDFGGMGGTPSHPEMLDWLAATFRDDGGSLKRLHRLIVTSAVYRQAARHDDAAAAKDADNRLLWRSNRRRLDAESLRDAVLLASGRLDETMYGPPAQQFLSKPGIHVTPEADYDRFDVDAPAARRRSVYRFIFRTRPDPMLEALDCPDASQSAPVRSTSLGAPQALVLWNNKFMLRQAEHLAALAERQANNPAERVSILCERLLGRTPSPPESRDWGEYAAKHGLANLCRVLLNSSEFAFVD